MRRFEPVKLNVSPKVETKNKNYNPTPSKVTVITFKMSILILKNNIYAFAKILNDPLKIEAKPKVNTRNKELKQTLEDKKVQKYY